MCPPPRPEPCPVPVKNPLCQKPLLQCGATGSKVAEIQKLLVHWDRYDGPVDGVFGSALEHAVKVFQRRVFLPENGIVDAPTWQSLHAGVPVEMLPLQRGSTGKAVMLLQEALQAVGHAIVVDGCFEQETEAAVKQFQRYQGLVVDGVVATCTWIALSKARQNLPETLMRAMQ